MDILLSQLFDGSINWIFHTYFMAFFFVLGGVLWWRMRREKAGWSELTEQHGLIFSEKAGDIVAGILPRFGLFRKGGVEQATQVLRGSFNGVDMVAFNWFYRPDSLTGVRGGFLCVVINLAKPMPPLRLFPESMDHFLSALDPDRLVLDDDAFVARFRLQGRGRDFAKSFFHPKMIETIMAGSDILLEINGDKLLIAKEGELLPNNTISEIEQATAIAELAPKK